MKILPKMLISFLSIVLLFSIVTTYAASLDSQREQKNINFLYEERGVSIAKTLDASIKSDEQLHADGQTIVDRLMASNMGVAEISIHGKAPEGEKVPGYWKGYWILASNDKSIVHTVSDAIVIVSMKKNEYIVASTKENGKPILRVTYPLHDSSGKPIATAGIKFDMSDIQSQMSKTNTNKVVISFFITILAIIATFVVANSITKPIERLKDVADKVSMGDLQQELKITGDDEIGELAQSFQRMINAFKMSQAMNEEESWRRE
jgi:methyl-accepting chemotaxis protein